jgi:hypothetical protein
MGWTIDKALADDLITVLDRNETAGEFTVRVGNLETPVTIYLRRMLGSEDVEFIVSHAIKTPAQMDPYRTSRTIEDDAPYALHRAISGITDWYRQGVRAGHTPSEQWLVRNEGYYA